MLRFFCYYNRVFRHSNNKSNNINNVDYKHLLLKSNNNSTFPSLIDYHSTYKCLFKPKSSNYLLDDYYSSSEDEDNVKEMICPKLKELILEPRKILSNKVTSE